MISNKKKSLNVFRLIFRKIKRVYRMGVVNYFRYVSSKNGSLVTLRLNKIDISVRKGTPDLHIAISCLIKEEFKPLVKHLDKNFSGLIIDAGGYIGAAALALHRLYPFAQVITIEPSRENIEILRLNVVGHESIKVVYGALVGGDVKFVSLKNRGTGECGFTTVENPLDCSGAEFLHTTPAFNLSSLGIDLSEIGILKLDIEGSEYDLFKNDAVSLKGIPVIAVELHDRITEGCTEAFMEFSEGRVIYKDRGEKYISVKKA